MLYRLGSIHLKMIFTVIIKKDYRNEISVNFVNTCRQNLDHSDLQHSKHHSIHMMQMHWSYYSSMSGCDTLILSEILLKYTLQCSAENFEDLN